MNRTFSRFAAAMIASTSLAGVSYGVANAATMTVGPDAVVRTLTVAPAATPNYSYDVTGSASVELLTTGAATASFKADFALTNSVAANTTRLYSASLDGGTWGPAARNFAALTVIDASNNGNIVPNTTIAVIGQGTDADNTVLIEMSTGATATATGDAFSFDFTVNGVDGVAAGSTISVTGKLALAADPTFSAPLETATSAALKIGAGASTTLTAGTAAVISGVSNFTQFTTVANVSVSGAPGGAAIGNFNLASGPAGVVNVTGVAYTAAQAFDGAGGLYTVAVTTNIPTGMITAMCISNGTAVFDLDCGDGNDMATTSVNTTTGTYTWLLGGSTTALAAFDDNATGNQVTAVTTGTATLSEGTFDMTITATTDTASLAANERASSAGASQTAFGTWVLGGLNAWLGPILVGNPSFVSVVRGTNSSAFAGSFMATVRDQTTATVIGTANTIIQAAVPSNAAWQMTADSIVTAVGGTLTGINNLTMQITCGCTGSAASLMLGGGVFSNVSSAQGESTHGSGK